MITFGTAGWTALARSIFNKVFGRTVLHTGVFETQVVFFTAQTVTGFPLTGSTTRRTAATHTVIWVTPVKTTAYQLIFKQYLF